MMCNASLIEQVEALKEQVKSHRKVLKDYANEKYWDYDGFQNDEGDWNHTLAQEELEKGFIIKN